MQKESLLKKELETFAKNKPELLSDHTGKYALIKDDKIIRIFESQNDAIKTGFEMFGNKPFLVKKIEAIEQTQNFTSNLILTRK